MNRLALALALVVAASIAHAGQQKTVEGLIINFGVANASRGLSLGPPSHAKAHSSGAKHLVVVLRDLDTGRQLGNAKVVVEVRSPNRALQTKVLDRGETDGVPDYSQAFMLGWSGTYRIRVQVERPEVAKPVRAEFAWTYIVP